MPWKKSVVIIPSFAFIIATGNTMNWGASFLEREDQVYKHDFKLTLLVVIKSLRENYSEVV
jgi:hypothetical protein